MDVTEDLAKEPLIVAADLSGAARNPRIVAAAAILPAEIRYLHSQVIESTREIVLDETEGVFRAWERQRLGALIVKEKSTPVRDGDAVGEAICDLVEKRGLQVLGWTRESESLRSRLQFLHKAVGGYWPCMTPDSLAATPREWLLPFVNTARGPGDIAANQIIEALWFRAAGARAAREEAERNAPAVYTTPAGSRIPIDYSGEVPTVRVRVQEVFGLSRHPTIGDSRTGLMLELLSPAMRPIQITADLPAFWEGSWQDVRREMRGRYPKHFWPENPATAEPTKRTKRK